MIVCTQGAVEEKVGKGIYVCVCERKQFDNIDNLLHRGQTRFLIMPSANISINLAGIV